MKNNNTTKKYSKTLDEMVKRIEDYLEKNPKDIKHRDINNPYNKEGYRKALEDFLFIIA